jgi:hypothetical protein
MERPYITEANCTTGEIIIREMNNEEYDQHLLDIARLEEVNDEG